MIAEVFECRCGWIGETPSITDTSEEAVNRHGEPIGGTVHAPVCPKCFEPVTKKPRACSNFLATASDKNRCHICLQPRKDHINKGLE